MLPAVAARVQAFAVAQAIPERAMQQVALALEELLANVIDHGRPADPIGLRVWREGDAVAAEISDDGLA